MQILLIHLDRYYVEKEEKRNISLELIGTKCSGPWKMCNIRFPFSTLSIFHFTILMCNPSNDNFS